MTGNAGGIRRGLLLFGITVAVILGVSFPARASFSAERTLQTTVTTASVAAPGDVSTAGSTCLLIFNARISWTPSDSARVTGYTVIAYFDDGSSSLVAETGATTTSVGHTYLPSLRRYWFTVTTKTDYGWTAESPRTAPVFC